MKWIIKLNNWLLVWNLKSPRSLCDNMTRVMLSYKAEGGMIWNQEEVDMESLKGKERRYCRQLVSIEV
jgi:hypothetical protein